MTTKFCDTCGGYGSFITPVTETTPFDFFPGLGRVYYNTIRCKACDGRRKLYCSANGPRRNAPPEYLARLATTAAGEVA